MSCYWHFVTLRCMIQEIQKGNLIDTALSNLMASLITSHTDQIEVHPRGLSLLTIVSPTRLSQRKEWDH